MKNVRSLLFLVAAVFLISGLSSIATAQKVDDVGASLAYIDQSTFTLSDSMVLRFMEWDTTDIATPLHVGAKKTNYKVLQFYIRNDGHTPDTLESVAFRSYNDKDFSVSRIRFYKKGNSTPLWQDTMPGAFSENTPLVASGLNVPIDTVGGTNDSLVFYFTFDSDSANVDTSYHALYLGLKITQNADSTSGVRMANAGYCPTVDADTLAYDNVSLGYGSGGRLVDFDTKPPELDRILFSLAQDNGGGCPGNGIVNLGDSIYIRVADTTGAFELASVKANLAIFGGTAATAFTDTIVYSTAPNPDDSAMAFGWRIPYTTFAGADEVSANFFWLVITAQDRSGNTSIDSISLPYDIDTEKPVFDDVVIGSDTVHVWMELSYDANGDDIAAVGDSLTFYSYLTSNPFNEVESVVIDLTGWGLGNISLDDQAGDRRYSKTIMIGPGAIDLAAGDSATIYYIWAYDNACNSATDSALSTYDIDNDIPGPPDDIVYNRLTDNDANNIVNIGDEVIIEVDASSTDDLATVCGISVDLLNSGLGGSPIQCLDSSGGLFTYEATVYDGGVYAVDLGANVHYVTITMTDDAGNTANYNSNNVIYTNGKMELPIDTESPPGAEDLEVTLGPCAMNLTWSGDADDSLYLVFWDGGDGWDANDYTIDTILGEEVYILLDTLGSTSDTTWWTTDATISLDHGTTYEFVVRTIDNANNREYNFDRASNKADCVAPVACIEYPELDGGAYGTGNELELIAETSDGDIANVRLWVRDADVGSGVPGGLQDFGLMTNKGGGVFTYTIDSTKMRNYGGFDCVDWHYEAVVQSTDTVGNVRSVPDILADCDYTTFEFDWFCAPLPLALISVNGAVTPQSGCGFDVTRDDQNVVEINVSDHTAGDTYVVDVKVILDWQYTRVYYNDTVSTMPFTFPLDATLFPKGTQTMWVEVTRDDGNSNRISAPLCVPDENAPMAYIYTPTDGQWVRKSCTFMSMIEVWAKIDTSLSYDFGGTTKVEFYESADGETWSLFDVVTGTSGGYWKAEWDNCAYAHGAAAYLRAIFYDNAGNTYTTAHVTVYVDGEAPDITLTMNPSQILCDDTIATVGGKIDLIATVNTVWEDIDEVYFIYAPADSPDIPSFYRLIGTGDPSTNNTVYTYYDFDTEDLVDGWTYRFRAIARDITGNTMWDYNGDGNMDAYTFDPINKNSDALYMIDNTPVTAAFGHAVITDGETVWHEFPTPSDKLGGADRIYAVQGMNVTLHTWTIPMDDTCCYEKVVYMVDGDEVAVSYGPPPFEVTFNPYDMGYVDLEDLNDDGYDDLDLDLTFYDCFGQTSTDEIGLYILNNVANPVVFTEPVNNECVAGEVTLEVLAINDYNVREVKYFWRESSEDEWIPIGSSTSGDYFPVTWYTVNAGVDDGVVQLGAISVDWAGNESDPAVINVTVANTPPVVEIIAPADMACIGYGDLVEAQVTSGDVVDMRFQYKAQTSESWDMFSRDFHEPWVGDFDPYGSDGYYHIRVKSYNCADVSSYSEIITVWYDNTDPRARLTSVAGQDAGVGDPGIDVTGMDTIRVTGFFADDQFEAGGCGLVKVGFMLMNDGEDPVREIILDATSPGAYSAMFDITGLGLGEYVCQAWALDAVGNKGNSQTIYIYITDQTAPIVALAAYHDSTLYAYDWSGDAKKVLFERKVGNDWFGIGIIDEPCLDRLWAAKWIPTVGTHTIRVISSDDGDNFDDASALTATFTYTSESNFSFGTTNITLEIQKNQWSDDLSGVLNTVSANGMPIVIALYDDGSVNYEKVTLDQNQQSATLYKGSWNAGTMGDGAARFFSSHPNTAGTAIEIIHTGLTVHEILPDFGTNGYVQDINGEVTLEVPPGAVDYEMTAVIMETWIPQAGIDQDHFNVISNPNGYGWYFGCNDYYGSMPEGKTTGPDGTALSSYYCCFNDNKYGVIKMYYDAADNTPAESLAVAWWDSYYNEWCFDGILYPAFVEGFNTEDHYVEFAVECLHGLYAVVSERSLPQAPTINIELLGDMYCGYFPTEPYFVLKVEDMSLMKEIDTHSWHIFIDDFPIVEHGDVSDYFDLDYDDVTNILIIEPYYYWDEYEDDYYDDFLEHLACGDHILTVGVKNIQGAYYEEAFDFTIDCAPPDVVFDNYYVGKNPTIRFYVADDLSGVDTSSIHVDIIAVGTNDTDPYNPDQEEYFLFLQTFFPEQITIQEDGLVEIPTVYDLEHKRAIIVVLYDGYRCCNGDPFSDEYYGGYGNINWDDYYSDYHGIHDCVGNAQTPVVQLLTIDNMAPTLWVVGYDQPGNLITALPGGCVEIQILDDGGGFDEDGITIYEDGEEIDEASPGEVEEGQYAFDDRRNIIEYCPTPGARIEVVVIDDAGNRASRMFGTGDPTQIFNATVDYNPWDPNEGHNRITIDFTGPATLKIYDFGGDLVKTMRETDGVFEWNGMTEDGTRVADGVYFGYIMVTTDAGNYSTVVKIAIVEK